MKVYYLSTCDTCKRIMKDVGVDNMEQQDIKTSPVTSSQFDEMMKLVDSPEDLLNKRARKLKDLNLTSADFTESKIKDLITTEYTFLKRPVFIDKKTIFTGNSKKTIDALKQYLSEK